jgi:CBS domain-containing protein
MERTMKNATLSPPETAPRHLDIRVCRVFGADGHCSTETTVECPRQERSVGAFECSACALSGGLHLDPLDRATSVVCKWPTVPLDPPDDPSLYEDFCGLPDPKTPLSKLMSKDVTCVRPDLGIDDLCTLFLSRGISGVPVVDEKGTPIGMVSKTDLMRAQREEEGLEEMDMGSSRAPTSEQIDLAAGYRIASPTLRTVGEIMTPIVLMLHESSNVGQAAALMAFDGVHRIPVVSDSRRVVGLLSSLDILRWFGRKSGYIIPRRPPVKTSPEEEVEMASEV